MPELPEVETIRRGLEQTVLGREIAAVQILYGGNIKAPSPDELQAGLPGRRIVSTGRRGKYLQLFMNDHSALVIHLRMTGKLVFAESPACPDKHMHLIFSFRDGSCLAYTDVRKFGTVWWLPLHRLDEIRGMAGLGPEPLSDDFTPMYLQQGIQDRKTNIKGLLLNQEFLAGLGNIYADEALHLAGIRPDRPASSLEKREVASLFHAIRTVLTDAIQWRGTTMSDYRDAGGQSGGFQERLRVYGRRDRPCGSCGTPVCRMVVAGRGTHFCPLCQQ
jgi:formamidopyrimidine-DNA glycosylase